VRIPSYDGAGMTRRRSRSRRTLPALIGAILLAVVLYFAGGTALDGVASGGRPSDGTAAALLETLPVKGRAPKTGYDREGKFGSAWLDVDRNGCNTRDDILARDLVDVVREGPCRVLSGVLADPYTATTIDFERGQDTSSLVQIDHIVPLLDAWQTGAQQASADERTALANDPLNLEAADGSANSSKGAGDAATWLPPNTAFRCEYVARQIAVKSAYGLWVTPAEHDAMLRVLGGCPDQPVPTAG
jgi:hypothetical protein